MTAKVIDFPNRPETFEDLIKQLEDAAPLVEGASMVVHDKITGSCYVFTFNVNAATLAFHALCLQKEAMFAGDLIVKKEEDDEEV